jgi:hypothetical protein
VGRPRPAFYLRGCALADKKHKEDEDFTSPQKAGYSARSVGFCVLHESFHVSVFWLIEVITACTKPLKTSRAILLVDAQTV